MRVDFTEERVMGASDALEVIFPSKPSQIAARIFVEWLKSKGGQASKSAVSTFADGLQGGGFTYRDKPFRYSKRNFYMTVVKTLISMGFIRRNVPVWDERSRRTLYVYVGNIFDIPQKPPSIGFWRLAYYVSKKWNKLLLEG